MSTTVFASSAIGTCLTRGSNRKNEDYASILYSDGDAHTLGLHPVSEHLTRASQPTEPGVLTHRMQRPDQQSESLVRTDPVAHPLLGNPLFLNCHRGCVTSVTEQLHPQMHLWPSVHVESHTNLQSNLKKWLAICIAVSGSTYMKCGSSCSSMLFEEKAGSPLYIDDQ